MNKADFVTLLETMVKAAMENIKSLELVTCVNEEFVIATCNSGSKYKICVTANSLIATAYDVINFLRFK